VELARAIEAVWVACSVEIQVEIEMECRVDTVKPNFYTADEFTYLGC